MFEYWFTAVHGCLQELEYAIRVWNWRLRVM